MKTVNEMTVKTLPPSPFNVKTACMGTRLQDVWHLVMSIYYVVRPSCEQ